MSDDLTVRRFWTLIGLCVGTLALVALVGLPADHELGQVDRSTASSSEAAPTGPQVDGGRPAPSSTVPPVVPATAAPPVTSTSSTTTGPVVVPVTAAPSTVGCGEWRDLIATYFPGEVNTACRVFIGCESKGDPNAVSPTDDHGLAQIHAPTWNRPGHSDPVADWIGRHWAYVYDPAVNLQMAAKIRAAYGWASQWTCF